MPSWTAAGWVSCPSRTGSNSSAAARCSAAARAAPRSASRDRGAARGTPSVSACRAGTARSPVSSPARSVSPTADTRWSSAEPPGIRVSRVQLRPGAHSPRATLTGTDTGTCGRTRSRTRSSRRCRRLASRSGASRSTWRSPTHQVPVPAPSATGRTSGPGAWPAPPPSSSRRVRISRRTVSAVGVGAWVMVAPLSFGGRCGGIGASVHYDHVPGGVVEPPSAVPGDGHDVLDADAEPAGQVDAGFDGEAHARHERLLLGVDHVGRLVRGDADAVPGAVDEVLPVAGVGDDRAGRPVDVLAGGAGAHGVESGLLGGAHEVVDAALLVGGLP